MTAKRLNTMTIALMILITAGFFFGLMIPGRKALREANGQVLTEQFAVSQRQRTVGDISDVYRELLTLSADIDTFREELPSDRRIGEFLNSLSELTSRVGVEVLVIQPLPALRVQSDALPSELKVANGTGIHPVKVVFRSDFKQAFEVVNAIERLPRLTYIEQMDIRAVDESNSKLLVTMIVQAFHHNHDQLLNQMPQRTDSAPGSAN